MFEAARSHPRSTIKTRTAKGSAGFSLFSAANRSAHPLNGSLSARNSNPSVERLPSSNGLTAKIIHYLFTYALLDMPYDASGGYHERVHYAVSQAKQAQTSESCSCDKRSTLGQ